MTSPELPLNRRIEALAQVADGGLALRDLLGLKITDTTALAFLGKAAFDGRRYEDARTIFSALVALEPDNPDHAFCVAEVEVKRGDPDAAVTWLDRYLHHDGVSSQAHRVNALLLRASLTKASRPEEAAADIAFARCIGQFEPVANAIVKAVLQ